ncbi:MAG: orotate phosphoribosyltransferase [Candidatus Latescibacterota bacterium]|jgi:orotate phosphoribosyltransferase
MSFDLLHALLQTQALRLAPAGEVFWYTSGTVGPYYINTQNLYGSPESAEELLQFIDREKRAESFAFELRERVERQYAENEIYRHVIDLLVAKVELELEGDIDAVSGGERRDWFFSLAVAERLNKPHLLIFKDLKKILLKGEEIYRDEIDGLKTLHVADLVTEASSYFRDWIPVVAQGGGRIVYSANVVDRGQGGIEALTQKGVPSSALLRVDEALFSRLVEAGRIDETQASLLGAYFRDPQAAMRSFLEEHPQFLRAALEGEDERTRARAQLLVDEDIYQLNS